MLDEVFAPGVQPRLESTRKNAILIPQYAVSIAKLCVELQTVESGAAEPGSCQALFDPAMMALQNVTYYTAFISDGVRESVTLTHDLQMTSATMQKSYENEGVVYVCTPIIIDDYLLMTSFPVT